ncbi:MAG TPA: hypothetical protein VF054_05690 [Micromonosporaceae bacterium]
MSLEQEQTDPEATTEAIAGTDDPTTPVGDSADAPPPVVEGGASTTPVGEAADTPTPIDDAPVTTVSPADEPDRWSSFGPAPERQPGRLRRSVRAVGRVLAHEWLLVSLAGLALSAAMTWPTLRYPASTIPGDIWDPTLQAWQMAWSGHIVSTDPSQLWNANAFYPDRYSFAFSDTLLGYLPAGLIGHGPVAALVRYNIMFWLLFALAFVGAYALARQLGSGRTGAAVAGVAFAYAPWRWGQAGHMHVLSTGGIALALAMIARGHGFSFVRGFQRDRLRPGWALAGWLVAAWQITLGFGIGLPFAYVMAGVCLVAIVWWLVRGRPRLGRWMMVADIVGALVFVAVGGLMARPYLKVVELHPYAKRSEADLQFFSPPLRGFFTAPPESLPWGSLHAPARAALSAPPEMALLPGFALYGLALAGLFLSVWRLRTRLLLLVGVVVSIALGMGTQFAFAQAGYLLLYRYLPGFESIRTPGRLVVWTTLLLALLAAGAVSALVNRAQEIADQRVPYRPGPLLRLATLLPLLLVLAEGTNQLNHPVVPAQPAALREATGPMLVLPSDQLTDENVMLWSTTRFQKMVNGGSGFTPRDQEQTREVAKSFPDPASVDYLRRLGVKTVIVLKDRVQGTPYQHAATDPVDGLGISRRDDGDTVVFTLN